MLFDRDALYGIFLSLPSGEKNKVWRLADLKGLHDHHVGTPERLQIVYDTLVELGHIIPVIVSSYEQAAEEYEETMQAMDLMGD